MKNLTIYFKPTDFCNVGCKHCYLTYTDRTTMKEMSAEELEKILYNLKDYYQNILKENEKANLFIQWHGGEPLLIAYENFKTLLETFDKFKDIFEFEHSIQTSLYPLFGKSLEENKKWYILFQEYFHSSIGTSFDFGGVRKYKGSSENYITELAKISLEMKNNFNIKTTLIMTGTKWVIDNKKEVFDLLMNYDKNFTYYQFEKYNDYNDYNKNSLSITNKEFSEFLIYIDKKLVENKSKKIIKIIEDAHDMIKDGIGRDKWSGTCMSNNIIINPDGETNNCVDKAHEESFGNIINTSFGDILRNKGRINWIKHQKIGHLNNNCTGCEFIHMCHTGCPLLKNDLKDDECSGYKSFLLYVKNKTK